MNPYKLFVAMVEESTTMKGLKSILTVLLLGCFSIGGQATAGAADATQSVSGRGVTVKVTYMNPRSDENPRFQAVLDTHSVALDGYDLKSLAFLLDDTGKTYAPTVVENTGSGHHRQVVLTFPKLSSQAKRIEVVIKDVAGVKERNFRWDLR